METNRVGVNTLTPQFLTKTVKRIFVTGSDIDVLVKQLTAMSIRSEVQVPPLYIKEIRLAVTGLQIHSAAGE